MAREGFLILDSDLHMMEPDDLWARYLEGPHAADLLCCPTEVGKLPPLATIKGRRRSEVNLGACRVGMTGAAPFAADFSGCVKE